MSTSAQQQFDICILCALPEEADRLKEAFENASEKIFHDQPPVAFKRGYNAHLKRSYDYTTITNTIGEQLGVFVIWLANNGPTETSLQLYPLLEEFKPRFAAMTGICAGDREKVKLGDIIVAERAFFYDTGKVIEGKNRSPELLRDTLIWSLPTEVLHFVRGFSDWKQAVTKEQEPRPLSRHQQRDWLLNTLTDLNPPCVDNIPLPELNKHAPDWRKIVQELQKGGDYAYLTADRILKDPARIRNLYYEKVFPFEDAKQPEVSIAPIASGSAVRADNPFEDIRVPVRGTSAVDMEGATFYRTFKEFSNIQYLLVKGVCDYADKEKDDSYHDYAGRISARYMFAFLREYVTSSRFPDIGQEEPEPSSDSNTPSEPSSQPESQNELNLFYSYAPEDENMRTKLGKHLVTLKASRGGSVQEVYANKIGGGLSNDAAALLERSQIILLLISSDFMATDDLYNKQLKRAFELQATGKARIVPVLLHPTEIRGTPLEDVVILPRNKPPISEWKSKDAAYFEVSQEIRMVIQEFIKSRK